MPTWFAMMAPFLPLGTGISMLCGTNRTEAGLYVSKFSMRWNKGLMMNDKTEVIELKNKLAATLELAEEIPQRRL